MLRNILTIAARVFIRQKGYTAINILGLTVGIASSLLILLWLQNETKVDRFHLNDSRLYQMKRNMIQDEGIQTTNGIPAPLKRTLDNDYPEVDKVSLVGWVNEFLFQHEDKIYRESGRYVSPEFFEIFTFPFAAGDPSTALNEVHSVVISEELALKYFGSDWESEAIGKVFRIDNRQEFTVTGVFSSIPSLSSLRFDWIINAEEYNRRNSWVDDWNNGGYRMVITLQEGADPIAFEQKVREEINKNTDGVDEPLFIQKFSEQHLYGTYEGGELVGGRIEYVRIFTVVAILIMLMACINFMNLATARSARRAREIGVRKVMGARRSSLSLQFLSEAVIMALAATLAAVLLVQLLLPSFNLITGQQIAIDFTSPTLWIIVIGMAMFTGLLSGSYPALFLSSFKVVNVIKGSISHSEGASLFRKVLVVFQFSMSILLIVGTITIYRQINYIMTKNLGLDRENLVMVDLEGETRRNFDTYRTQLMQIPEVKQVSSSNQSPLFVGQSSGGARWQGRDPEVNIEISILSTSDNFVQTMKMELIAGRGFAGNVALDTSSFIINEEAARVMDMDDPVGQALSLWGTDGTIIGMVRDFHIGDMYSEIEPLIIRYDPPYAGRALIRIEGDIPAAVEQIQEVTSSFNPGLPVTYEFLDEQYEQSYNSEMVMGSLANYFAVIGIFISCLGLFGLSSYMAEQRRREIGIRKVLGATVSNVVVLLSGSFAKLILIAYLISLPVSFYFSRDWLSGFAYRTSLSVSIFIYAGIGALLLALITISFKSVQVARSNPVDSLKEE